MVVVPRVALFRASPSQLTLGYHSSIPFGIHLLGIAKAMPNKAAASRRTPKRFLGREASLCYYHSCACPLQNRIGWYYLVH